MRGDMSKHELVAQIQQDLNDARMLLEKSGGQDEKKKYHKAAEIILIKTLHLDPENEKARALLQYARSAPAERARDVEMVERNDCAVARLDPEQFVRFAAVGHGENARRIALEQKARIETTHGACIRHSRGCGNPGHLFVF